MVAAFYVGPLPAEELETGQGDAPHQAVSFYTDIRPIFQAHCHGCHQPAKQSGEYVMTDFPPLLAGGESGEPAIVAGQPDASYLIQQVTPQGDQADMPKGKPPLSDAQIATISAWIAAGAQDDSPPSVRQLYDNEHPPEYYAPPVITSLDFSPDGQHLAVSGYHEVLLHMADGSEIASRLVGISERIESAVFSPDGRFLAVTGGSPGRMGELQIWDVDSRSLLLSLPVTHDTIYGASWSPDGTLVAFGCSDNSVRAIELASGKQVVYNAAHNDWVLDTAFSTQGTHLVSVSRDRSLKLVEVATERFIDNITSITPGALKGGLHAVACHPTTDHLLVGGADSVPKIFRMERKKKRSIGDDHNLIRAFDSIPGRIFDVAFSKDGSRIVAGSSLDGAGFVHVYQTDNGDLVAKMDQPAGVFAVDFAEDGKVVASGGFDGSVYLHESDTGKLIKTFMSVPLLSD